MASGPSIIGRLFTKGSVAEQIFEWAILAAIVQALGEPGIEQLRQLALAAAQNTVLSPAELADAVIKGHMEQGRAAAEATASGLDAERFQTLVDSAGEPPGPAELAEALRRKLIPEQGTGADSISFEQGIREGRLRNKWTDTVKGLAIREPTPADALDALLEGQLPEDQVRELYQRFGGDPEHFTWLFNSRGSAPTPIEASEMARRGIIPFEGEGPQVTSFHQAFLEGPWRNKWEDAFRELARYIPPPRAVTAMLRNGSITQEQAQRWYQDAGASPEVVAALLTDASHRKSRAERALTVGQILDLYEARAISAQDATTLLADMGYSETEAAQLLSLRDLQREIRAVNAAVSRIGALYIARKIDKPQAVTSLNGLHLPDRQISELLGVWDLERQATVRTLTPAEIVAAFHWKIFDQSTAISELANLGYTPFDAWALLSIRQHEPLPGRPAQ